MSQKPSPQSGYVKRQWGALEKGKWAAIKGAAPRRDSQLLQDPEL